MTPTPLRVLFLCTANACRSQMAEGWARALGSDLIEPFSAGVRPSSLDRLAVLAMREAGVDISAQRSKGIEELGGRPFDVVVTVCDAAQASCPTLPGRHVVLHAPFEDPPRLAALAHPDGDVTDAEALPHYRRVRDEIRRFVERLPEHPELRTRAASPRSLSIAPPAKENLP
ncbi:MAG TPA: arsenate reductase ArsC [Phycisphaerales bacterium]|nr:arsenate reductase ArsC [Phycisphaerales bacterium]HMP37005.1 arsenate reductase ArsC [Phycisphaerales bacterium]